MGFGLKDGVGHGHVFGHFVSHHNYHLGTQFRAGQGSVIFICILYLRVWTLRAGPCFDRVAIIKGTLRKINRNSNTFRPSGGTSHKIG